MLEDDGVTSGNPLLAPLDTVQLDLLAVIADPILKDPCTDRHAWPIWEYVAIAFEDQHPDENAERVWASLPWISTADTRPRQYGLVWAQNSNASLLPLGNDSVGLSIPGLWRLKGRNGYFKDVALEASLLMGRVADLERWAPRTPWHVITLSLQLGHQELDRRPTSIYASGGPGEPSIKTLGELLHHEFVRATGDQTSSYSIQTGQRRFAAFMGITNPIEYADAVWRLSPTAQTTPPRSSLPLPETLDYLGYVLEATGKWTGPRLTELTLLGPVAGLNSSASSAAELDARLSELWNVIGGLRVGVTDAQLEAAGFDPKQAGSLNRLVAWLRVFLGSDYDQAAGPAVKLIRDSRSFRNAVQHPARKTREAAETARLAFGLPAIGSSPEQTWVAIRDGVAGAFNVIRREVQAFSSA